MGQIKYLLFILICIFIFPLVSHGECDYQRKAELSRLAGNVKINYSYSIVDDTPIFNVNITNVSADLYVKDNYGNIINGEYSTEKASGSYSYDIYSYDCQEKLVTKSLTLPVYNSYSQTDECKKYPNFKYCNLWGNYSIDYYKFLDELNVYKKQSDKNNYKEEKTSIFSIMLEVLLQHKVMIIILFSMFLITFFCLKLKKKAGD